MSIVDKNIAMYDELKEHPAYQYALDVVSGKYIVGRYIKKECEKFLKNVDDPDCKYFIDVNEMRIITNLTKVVNMATGVKAGTPAYDSLGGFQWYFIINALCWKHKKEPTKRRYEKSILLIGRKSGKTFLVSLIFIILLLKEEEFSEFYSVAPDKELSGIIKKEMEQAISVSPLLSKHFELLRSEIRCNLSKSKFTPLANSNNRMDGRRASVWVSDETGALSSSYPIEAMQSSQMNMTNRTGIIISTAYDSVANPMVDEVNYAEKVLDEIIEDDKVFSLIYKPDDPKNWMSDDSMYEANPLIYDVPQNKEFLDNQRNRAIEMPSARKNYMTKHLNIFVDGGNTEQYVQTEDLLKVRLDEDYDWNEKEVYIGVDLAQSDDNVGVSMVHYDKDNDNYYLKSWAFIPADRVSEKSKIEKVDYELMQDEGCCVACGTTIIDYSVVEEFVESLEDIFGVSIIGIGYDRYNAISSVNKWSKKYYTIEVPQNARVLHPATKRMKEKIMLEEFNYDKNKLLELNFSNAKVVYDNNLNMYINKKKSNGKIDMVASTINAMTLWFNDVETAENEIFESGGGAIII